MARKTLLSNVAWLSAGAALLFACGTDNSSFADGAGNNGTGTSSGGDKDGFGSSGSSGSPDNNTSVDTGPECASAAAVASLTKAPVDIIFVIDNSSSMSGEILEVQKQVNDNFRTIIEKSGIDYRVIMVTRHGGIASESVCISAPLSGAQSCSPPPAKPTETARFFHYNVEIASHNAWCQLLSTIDQPDTTDGFNLHPNGWGELLRPGAFKTFIVMTDDNVSCTFGNVTFTDSNTAAAGNSAAAAFDAALLAKDSRFGTAQKRNYVFHSIVSLKENPAGAQVAYQPTDAITTSTCKSGAQNPGTGYQALSVLTKGLRFPTCDQGGVFDYSPIFNEVAKGIVKSSSVSCDFPVPQPAAGQTLDMSTLAVQYKAGGTASPVEFAPVADLSACGPDKFYVEGGSTGTVHLCPDTCTTVKSDALADIRVVSGCARLNGGVK